MECKGRIIGRYRKGKLSYRESGKRGLRKERRTTNFKTKRKLMAAEFEAGVGCPGGGIEQAGT